LRLGEEERIRKTRRGGQRRESLLGGQRVLAPCHHWIVLLIHLYLLAAVDDAFGFEEEGVEVVADDAEVFVGQDGIALDQAVLVLVVVPAFAAVAFGGVEEVDFHADVGVEEEFAGGFGGCFGHTVDEGCQPGMGSKFQVSGSKLEMLAEVLGELDVDGVFHGIGIEDEFE
jgi:hypothetical protein